MTSDYSTKNRTVDFEGGFRFETEGKLFNDAATKRVPKGKQKARGGHVIERRRRPHPPPFSLVLIFLFSHSFDPAFNLHIISFFSLEIVFLPRETGQ